MPGATGTPTKCAAGTFAQATGMSACDPCPDEFYSLEGSEVCTPVPPGYSANIAGGLRTGITICPNKKYSAWGEVAYSDCPDGFLCPEGTGFSTTWEYSCPKGSYCMAGQQYMCPEGTFGLM